MSVSHKVSILKHNQVLIRPFQGRHHLYALNPWVLLRATHGYCYLPLSGTKGVNKKTSALIVLSYQKTFAKARPRMGANFK